MKTKCVLLICILGLMMALVGCSATSSSGQNIAENTTSNVIDVDNNKDLDLSNATQEDETQETNSENSENNSEKRNESKNEEKSTKIISKDIKAEALKEYYGILKAAPAIEGEHGELYDASFGYEDNYIMFGNHLDTFCIYDINKDGVPELIASSTVNFRWMHIYVYTYVEGQAILLKDPDSPSSHGTFDQCATANGSYMTYFCDDNHIHSLWFGSGMEEDEAYSLEGANLKLASCDGDDNHSCVYYSDISKPNTAENIRYMAQ